MSIQPDTHVPTDETPHVCPYCERPFRGERAHALHVGERHGDRMTDAERDAYEAAKDDEEHDLFGFHIAVFVVIAITQGLVVLLYMIAFGGGI
ncbi:DUF7410 domain-containing protein [Halorarius halobius]|uniref:DUF7410 domain-containing protein n=1 Tax=Halorarius halobius TaxID=2962671 RepID=UPI0020CFBA9A|nr:DNA-binding protein [Halorarius halobius]